MPPINLKYVIAAVLVALVAAVGITKLTLHFRVKAGLDRFVEQLSPIASVSYDGVHSGLDGSIGADDIVIRPYQLGDEIHIDQVRFQVPNVFILFGLEEQIKNDEFPESMTMSIQGLRIETDGELIEALAKNSTVNWFGLPWDTLACGDVKVFSGEDLRAMGYTEIVQDMSMEYRYLANEGSVRLTMDIRSEEAQRLNLELNLEDTAAVRSLAATQGAQPRIKAFSLLIEDLGLNSRRNAFCEAITDQSDFPSRHANQLATAMLQQGIEPSAAVVEAYEGFVRNGGSVRLDIEPTQPINPMEAAFWSPKDLSRVLSPKVSFNGKTVEGLRFSTERETANANPLLQKLPEGMRPEREKDEEDASQPKPLVPKQVEFRDTAFSELPLYVGQPIRVTDVNGNVTNGRIDRVTGARVVVTTRMHGGSATLPIRREDIQSIEVLR